MIVKKRPNGLHLFFILRGSVIPRIIRPLAATVALSIAVTCLHGKVFDFKVTLTPIPFSLIGLALAIFFGFRNTASYDRFWEGRRQWGELVIRTRSLARMVSRYGTGTPSSVDLARATTYRIIAFVQALKHHLRGTEPDADLEPLLSDEERRAVLAQHNRPDALVRLLTRDIAALRGDGRISDFVAMEMERQVTGIASVQAACERIRHTPLPFSYTLLLHRTAYLYCFALPFGLVDSIGTMTPFVVAIVCYAFFGLDALGDEIEEPFGLEANDLPLATMARTIERDLRAALQEPELPPPLQPVRECLL